MRAWGKPWSTENAPATSCALRALPVYDRGVEWIFGKPVEDLRLDELRAFLDDAGDEPLTWELKGDEREGRWVRREQVLKAVCGFANADRGRVLIIGGHKRRGASG